MELFVDPAFYAMAIPAVLITGLSKGGFGGGIAMLGTPMIALVVSPVKAAAIMLPVLIVMDMIGLWNYRTRASWTVLRAMLPGAFAGILLGWATAAYVSDDAVRILVGAIALVFAVAQILAEFRRAEPAAENTLRGSFWGLVAGFTSFVSHAGGPPFQAYTLPLKLDKLIFAGTGVVFFAIVNAAKVVPYFALGQFATDNLFQSLLLLPVAICGVFLGIWTVRRVSQKIFYWVTYAAMILVGAKLIHDGVLGLF